jgi:WD40 repeat protein
MPTTINASNTSGGAIITPDGSGVLELQSGGVTGLTVSGANVTVAGTLTATGGLAALTSPVSVIGNASAGAEIRLPEDTDNGANYVAIKAPNALAANLTFTLPTADGTNGQYLQTNGSGQLTFASVPATTPGGTTGQVQVNNAGAFGAISEGTAGQVLTSGGAGVAPTFATLSTAVQYPQNIQSADYTLVLSDAGKQIFHPVADALTRTYTIPANSSVAFPIGTVVLFTVENGGIPVNVTCGDTLVFGNGATGTILVPSSNTLMAIKITATKWFANYLYQAGIPASFYIAVGNNSSPRINIYPWSGSGFGEKVANPATVPPGTSLGVAFNPARNVIATGNANTPYTAAYSWSGSGFGTKFADPATLPANDCHGVAFSPDGNAIALASIGTPFVFAYPWSNDGFGTKFTNPATLPTSAAYGVAFSPAGNAIAVAHDGPPHITAYPWSISGFGTKFTNPATLPTNTGNGVAFSPAGDAIAVAHATTPFVTAYPWDSSTGFGTKFTNPATLPTGIGNGVAFSPAGDAIAVAHATTPFVTAYPWSISGFGTKFTNPATLPTGTGNGVAFSPAGDAIAVAHATTPFVTAYPWSGSGFGTKFANPATLPTGTSGESLAFTIN